MATLAPFAAAEALVNQGIAQHLANAVATFNGGEPFGVLFDRKAADPYGTGEVDATAYTASFCVANAPGLARGGQLSIDGAAYRVASDVQPDASGWVYIDLFKTGA